MVMFSRCVYTHISVYKMITMGVKQYDESRNGYDLKGNVY